MMVDANEEQGMTYYVHDDITIEYLANKTNFDELLFSVVTSDSFELYARSYLRPFIEQLDFHLDFKKLSRKVLRQKIIDVYNSSKKELKETFNEFTGRLVVTCDLWSSFNGVDRYVSIICHWINEDWGFEKRVIGFELLNPYGYVDIASKIVQVLDEFNLKDKVGSISFDDCVSKEKCMEHLCKEFNPIVLDLFSHDRTFANVVDLCGQQIMDELAEFINPIRELVKWFQSKPDKKQEYKTWVKNSNMCVLPVKFCIDYSKGWLNTFECLEHIEFHREILAELYDDCASANHSPSGHSPWDYYNSYVVCFIEKFRNVAGRFTWPRDVNCHLVIYDCISIARTLNEYEDDPILGSVVRNIRSKWLELFPEIPNIYCVAAILDPRVKVEGLRQLLVYYYETLGVDYNVDEKVGNCKNALEKLHSHYAPASSSEGEETSWDFNVYVNVLKRKRVVDDQGNRGDLAEYLFFEFEFSEDDNDEWFEILQWWAKREELFPVLSKIAKDVLCIPMSTDIPKSDRCPSKRVLDEKRSRLPEDLIRVCICKKHWELVEQAYVRDEDDSRDASDSEADEMNDCKHHRFS